MIICGLKVRFVFQCSSSEHYKMKSNICHALNCARNESAQNYECSVSVNTFSTWIFSKGKKTWEKFERTH